MDYYNIVFDITPIGHTLRLLQFLSVLKLGLTKIMSFKNLGGVKISNSAFASAVVLANRYITEQFLMLGSEFGKFNQVYGEEP